MSCFSGEEAQGEVAERRFCWEPPGPALAVGHVTPGFAVEVGVGMPQRLFDAVVVNQPIAVLDAVAEFVVIHLPAENERAAPLQSYAHDLARAAVTLRFRVSVSRKPVFADEDALASNPRLGGQL